MVVSVLHCCCQLQTVFPVVLLRVLSQQYLSN